MVSNVFPCEFLWFPLFSLWFPMFYSPCPCDVLWFSIFQFASLWFPMFSCPSPGSSCAALPCPVLPFLLEIWFKAGFSRKLRGSSAEGSRKPRVRISSSSFFGPLFGPSILKQGSQRRGMSLRLKLARVSSLNPEMNQHACHIAESAFQSRISA